MDHYCFTGTPVCDDESEMLCKNPQYDSTLCIPMNLRCDGHDDCGDAADEANCTGK